MFWLGNRSCSLNPPGSQLLVSDVLTYFFSAMFLRSYLIVSIVLVTVVCRVECRRPTASLAQSVGRLATISWKYSMKLHCYLSDYWVILKSTLFSTVVCSVILNFRWQYVIVFLYFFLLNMYDFLSIAVKYYGYSTVRRRTQSWGIIVIVTRRDSRPPPANHCSRIFATSWSAFSIFRLPDERQAV